MGQRLFIPTASPTQRKIIWQLVLGLAKFYLGLARNSKLQNILMLSDSKLPFQRIFWGQRLFRSTASPIQLENNLAVGARVSDIYLGSAPELKLENILMLSLLLMAISGTRPEQMPCYLPEFTTFLVSNTLRFMHWNKKLPAERVIGIAHRTPRASGRAAEG